MENLKNKDLSEPISHRTARLWIQAAADEQLAAHQQATLQAHLDSCQRCQNYATNITALERQLRMTLDDRQAQYAPGELTKAIAAVKNDAIEKKRDVTPGRVSLRVVQFAALVILMFVLTWSIQYLIPGLTPNPASTAQSPVIGALATETTTPTSTSTSLPPTETLSPPTETPLVPTETLSPAMPLSTIDELVGTWKGRWSDTSSIYIEFKVNGNVRIFFAGGESFGDTGTFTLEDSKISWKTATGSCEKHPLAIYEVRVVKRGDVLVQLQFTLVGEDLCIDRVDALDGKTLIYQTP